MNNIKLFFIVFIFAGCSIQLISTNSNLKFVTLNQAPSQKIDSFCTNVSSLPSQLRIDKISVEEPYSSYRLYIHNDNDTVYLADSFQWASTLAHLYPHRVKALINTCTDQHAPVPVLTTDITSRSQAIIDLTLTRAQFNIVESSYEAYAQTRCSLRNEVTGKLRKLTLQERKIALEESPSATSSIKELNNAIDQATIACLIDLINTAPD